MSTNFIFKAKTQEGTIIKNLFELLQQCIKTTCLEIDETGISMCSIDAQYKTLIDFKLDRENFLLYECREPMIVGINVSHLHKMLKSIKKKDSIVLFISSHRPNEFAIKIEPKENMTRSNISFVKIQGTHKYEVELPTGYGNPVVTSSTDYQKMCKDMSNISKTMEVISEGRVLHFICDAGELYSREVSFGNDEPNPVGLDRGIYSNLKEGKKMDEIFFHVYNTNTITKLVKMTGLSQNIQIYSKQELPLQFKLKVGSLGNISIYIKSNEQLSDEADEDA